MTTLLIVAGSLAYAAIGMCYGRSVSRQCYARARQQWHHEDSIRESANLQVALRVCLWPFAVVTDAARSPIRDWIFAPQREHQERIQQLREDAATWRQKHRDHSVPQHERSMAAQLADLCTQMADELERS